MTSKHAKPPLVTVITPTVPERAHLLETARGCAQRQTLQPVAHLWRVDRRRRGPAAIPNRLVKQAESQWVAFLDDDDLIDDDHLEALHQVADASRADVVASWWRWDPEPGPFLAHRLAAFDADLLRTKNYIPVTVLARAEAIKAARGRSARS
jgi:hypothetical protein